MKPFLSEIKKVLEKCSTLFGNDLNMKYCSKFLFGTHFNAKAFSSE
jgi:hypothetical protein